MDQELKYKPLYRDWLNLSFHLLWCYEQPMAPHPRDVSVYKNNAAWLIRRGWAEVEHNGQVWRATQGQWLIVKPVERLQRWSADAKLLSVAFDAQWPDGTSLISDGLSMVLNAADHPALEQHALPLVRSMKKVLQRGWDARQHAVDFQGYMRLQAQLSLWLTSLVMALRDAGLKLNVKQNMDERVMQAVRILDGLSYAEPVDVDELAEKVGMSTVHLTRRFKEQLQITPVVYQNRLRIEQAKRRLHMPGVRVKEVAIELGFCHLSHFSRWFKQYAGEPPRRFLKKVQ
jgi:AraC-like DNA-binding protein